MKYKVIVDWHLFSIGFGLRHSPLMFLIAIGPFTILFGRQV